MADVYNLGFGGMNPYTQGAVNSTMNDMARNYNLIDRPQQANSMAKSGSFGNSGLQQMQQNADQNQATSMGNVAGNMQNNAYLGQQQFGMQAQAQQNAQQMNNQNFGLNAQGQNFNQGLQSANLGLNAQNQAYNQNMGTNQFNANQYWTGQNFDAGRYDTAFNQNQQSLNNYMNLTNQQNQMGQQDITNSTNVQNAPMNYFNSFNQQANSIGQGYGTDTSSTAMPSNPFLGALGGWSLGSSIAKA
jgi:hypothetical protein